MRVAVIGCGSIGTRHARNLKSLGHEVVPVDVNHQRAASLAYELGEDGWSDYLQAFDRLDAVMICAPASAHAANARRLLDAARCLPLFVEKPLALTVEECKIFRSWPHPTTMVGYNWIFNDEVREWLDWRYTASLPMQLSCNTDMRQWPGAGYGDPLAECSHEIHLLQWLRPGHRLSVSNVQPQRDCDGVRIDFDTGDAVIVRWNVPPARLFLAGTRRLFPCQRGIDGSYVNELEHFLACAQSGAPTSVPFADGIRVLDLIEQARAMAAI